MELQEQNWHRFCRHHAGDWHGTWLDYSPTGEVMDSKRCVRSFRVGEGESQIDHQNHYTYKDGRQETNTFGPYYKPRTISLFLDRCFSWGTTDILANSNFGFETGFRHENRRMSVAAVCDRADGWKQFVIITEHLDSWGDEPEAIAISEPANWRGTAKTMTPDFNISEAIAIPWYPLNSLGDDYLSLPTVDGISLSVPKTIETGKPSKVAAEWFVKPDLIYRGIREFDGDGHFQGLTVECFEGD